MIYSNEMNLCLCKCTECAKFLNKKFMASTKALHKYALVKLYTKFKSFKQDSLVTNKYNSKLNKIR